MLNPRLPTETVDKRVYNQGASFLIVERSPIELCGQFDPQLAQTLSYLNFLRAGQKMPRAQDIDRSVFGNIAKGSMYHIVDVTSHDPLGFKFDEFDRNCPVDDGHNHAGLVLGDYPDPVITDFLTRSYRGPRDSEVARLDKITWLAAEDGAKFHCYHRYIYPLAADGLPGRQSAGGRTFGFSIRLYRLSPSIYRCWHDFGRRDRGHIVA